MAFSTGLAAHPSTCEIRVTASDRRRARLMACLLADVGQAQGWLPLTIRTIARPEWRPRNGGTEWVSVQFAGESNAPAEVVAVLDEDLYEEPDHGLVLLNSRESRRSDRLRSLDANSIASALGVPAYLPMVGAVARLAGWSNLEQVKSAVGVALQESAPQWLQPGLQAVEAGYRALA
ncbi:MAG TPA: hypothetical protein VIL07_02690 [Symbiobacteriaceae bacterium]